MNCNSMKLRERLTRTAKWGLPRAVILANLLSAACSSEKEKPKAKPAVPVKVATAVQKTVPVQIRVIGNVEPYNTVSIKAQVNGMLDIVHFREGQDVKKGQMLFT